MTVGVLAGGWLLLAGLVARRAGLLSNLAPRPQLAGTLMATVGLGLIPWCLAVLSLNRALSSFDGTGLGRCGRLVAAILYEPVARPDLTGALVVAIVLPLGFTVGAVSAWRSQAGSRRLARSVRASMVLLPTKAPVAFTTGLLRPRVVVSEGFLAGTPRQLQRAVMAHEEAHRRGRHGLVLFIVESLARGLPLPPLRWGADAVRFALEALADDRASGEVGSRHVVAEAIATLALASHATALGFEGDAVRRVRRLQATPTAGFGLPGTLALAAIVAILAFAGTHVAHCTQDSSRMLGVVQCRFK